MQRPLNPLRTRVDLVPSVGAVPAVVVASTERRVIIRRKAVDIVARSAAPRSQLSNKELDNERKYFKAHPWEKPLRDCRLIAPSPEPTVPMEESPAPQPYRDQTAAAASLPYEIASTRAPTHEEQEEMDSMLSDQEQARQEAELMEMLPDPEPSPTVPIEDFVPQLLTPSPSPPPAAASSASIVARPPVLTTDEEWEICSEAKTDELLATHHAKTPQHRVWLKDNVNIVIEEARKQAVCTGTEEDEVDGKRPPSRHHPMCGGQFRFTPVNLFSGVVQCAHWKRYKLNGKDDCLLARLRREQWQVRDFLLQVRFLHSACHLMETKEQNRGPDPEKAAKRAATRKKNAAAAGKEIVPARVLA
jgi:hypothetical protein